MLSRLDFTSTVSLAASVLSGRIHQLHGDCVSYGRKAISEKEEGTLGLVLADDGLLGLYFTIQADKNYDRFCLQEKKKLWET